MIFLSGLLQSACLAQGCKSMPTLPNLPRVTPGVFPGEGLTAGVWRTVKTTALYDTWEPGRKEIATLPSNTQVLVRNGLLVVGKPDQVQVTKPIGRLNLGPGDEILRYGYFGEGEADLWVKGCWYGRFDAGFITEMDGAGCHGQACTAIVTRQGTRTWWLEITLPDGKSGWSRLEDLSFVW